MEDQNSCCFNPVWKFRLLFIFFFITDLEDVVILLYHNVSNNIKYYTQLLIVIYVIVKIILLCSMILLCLKKEALLVDIYQENKKRKLSLLVGLAVITNLICGGVLLMVQILFISELQITIVVCMIPNILLMFISVKFYINKNTSLFFQEVVGSDMIFDKKTTMNDTD